MSSTELSQALRDLVAIPVTPYLDGELDIPTFRALLRRLVDNGVRVITPNGNTSEFYALTAVERRALIKASADEIGSSAHILVGVGHAIATAVADVLEARSHGIRMAMIHQPVHPHISAEGWVDYHAAIATAVPDMAFVLYIRNEWVTPAMVRRLGEQCANVIGIKYAVADAAIFARMRTLAGAQRFVWIAGLAEPYSLSYAVHGADGFTSGLVNVNPRLALRLRDCLRSGDYRTAATLLEQIARFEELRALNRSADNVSIVKEALHQLGLCDRATRAPSHSVDAATRDEIAQILAEWSDSDDLVLEVSPTAGATR